MLEHRGWGVKCFLALFRRFTVRFPAQPAVYRQPHRSKTGQAADNIGNGLCQKHPVYPESGCWQKQGQRHNDNGLAQQRKENRASGIAKRLKRALSRELECHKAEPEKIYLQCRSAGFCHGCIFCKDRKQQVRDLHNESPGKKGICGSNQCRKTDAFFDTGKLPGSVIIAKHRLGTAGQSHNGQR